MSAAYFYTPFLEPAATIISLDEANAKHAIQVLRMKPGQEIHLTDGKGNLALAEILEAGKKNCSVRVISSHFTPPDSPKLSIGLSLLKNTSRFEWFLEKATELGVSAIFPLLCQRTEKQQFRFQRMQGIVESALVQSQQAWIPTLHEPVALNKLLEQPGFDQKFIAHCAEDQKMILREVANRDLSSQLMLIGPEGDFTENEIARAIDQGFIAVSLGSHRLRSETAALAAVSVLK